MGNYGANFDGSEAYLLGTMGPIFGGYWEAPGGSGGPSLVPKGGL